MFSINMKILTRNTNKAMPDAHDGITLSTTKELINSGNNGNDTANATETTSGSNNKINKREQKHINKIKFLNVNNKMPEHITQQNQHKPQTYHNHKNNNNNGSKLKTQYYNNSNSNKSNSSLIRKQHYQYQQQKPQQQLNYYTSLLHATNSKQTTAEVANNNNSNLVKNQNFDKIDKLVQQPPEQLDTNSDTAKNSVKQPKNLFETCTTCLLSSSPATSQPTAIVDYLRHNELVNADSQSLPSGTVKTTSSSATSSNSLTNTTELSQQKQTLNFTSTDTLNYLNEFVASAAAASTDNKCNSNLNSNLSGAISSSATTSTTTLSATTATSATTTPSASKKKLLWKNSNTGGGGICDTFKGNSLTVSTNQSPRLSKEKTNYAISSTSRGKDLGKNTSNNDSNVQKNAKILVANDCREQQKQISKLQVETVEKTAMTSSLAASSGSTSNNISVSSNNNTTSSFAKILSTKKPKRNELEKQNDYEQMVRPLCSNSSLNTKAGSSPSPTPTSSNSVPSSSSNSYTLDFLHSVGMQVSGADLRSSSTQESSKSYDNSSVNDSSLQPRYMYSGSNSNNANSKHQQQQHYNHHHHQPSQLTIASFLHEDLLGRDSVQSNKNRSRNTGGVSLSSCNSRSTNYYNDHLNTLSQNRYHHNYYATPFQQKSDAIQHSNYGSGVGYGREVNRFVKNCNGGGVQRNAGFAYANYRNTTEDVGTRKSFTYTQQHARQLQNKFSNYKDAVDKKPSCASSTTSTCSSSSSKSIESDSSHLSGRQLQAAAATELNNKSDFNLVIETLPSKMGVGFSTRGNHRGHHHSHYGHYQRANHQTNHHNHQHAMINSPNVLQHQNYYNLTYVSTEGSISGGMSRGCSSAPTPLSANFHSPKSLDNNSNVTMLMNFNTTSHLQYPRYPRTQQLAMQNQQQFHQFHHQKQNFKKKFIVPLTLNMPPPSPPTPTLTSPPQVIHPSSDVLCYSHSDKGTNSVTSATTKSVIITGNDYESDSSSDQLSTKVDNHALKPIKSFTSAPAFSSSSPLPFAVSVTNQQVQQQNCSSTPPTTCESTKLLDTPYGYNYSVAVTHAFPNQQFPQLPHLPQFYSNNGGAVVSLLNVPTQSTKTCANEDYHQQQQQQQQQQQFYFNASATQRPAEFSNNVPALTVANQSSSGYWSPSYHNNQFIYHHISSNQVAPIAPTASSSSSSSSSSASISPRLANDELQLHQNLYNNRSLSNSSSSTSPYTSGSNEPFSNRCIGNSMHADSEMISSSSSYSSNSSSVNGCSNNESGISINSAIEEKNYKKVTPQLLAQKRMHQYSSSSMSSLSNSSVSTLSSVIRGCTAGVKENGDNIINGRSSQLPPPLLQTIITSSVSSSGISAHQPLSCTTPYLNSNYQQHQQQLPPQVFAQPHNLLLHNNNSQNHFMRALNNLSINDLFAHTPPDRFLARAHLIEIKEAPPTLLNNSKWDRLSQSIWQKFINSQQTEETFKHKMRLWRNLYIFIKNTYPRFGLYLVGSTISGFGSDSSDVDMCLVSRTASNVDPRLEALYNLTVLRDCLSKSGEFENFNLIEAKVPILRFCDRMHHLEIDLNFNNCVGIKNTHLLYCYSQLDWRLRPLALVTKLWAQYHNINNAKNMTISSYSLVLMVIHFLQYAVNPPVLPCLHEIYPEKFTLLRSNDFGYVDLTEAIGPHDSQNTQTIGELFLLLLEYYSCFDYTKFAISVRTGGVLPINVCRIAKSIKNDVHQWKELCIEEPFDLTNTARSVYDYETFERVKAVFVASWHMLQETLDLNSVFSSFVISSPYLNENTAIQQNINPTTIINLLNNIKPDVDVSNTKLKDMSVVTSVSENHEETKRLLIKQIEESITNKDDDDVITDNNATVTSKSCVAKNTTPLWSKRNDLNKPLTSCQIKEIQPSSSMLTCIKNNAKNVIRNNNNNKTVSPILS